MARPRHVQHLYLSPDQPLARWVLSVDPDLKWGDPYDLVRGGSTAPTLTTTFGDGDAIVDPWKSSATLFGSNVEPPMAVRWDNFFWMLSQAKVPPLLVPFLEDLREKGRAPPRLRYAREGLSIEVQLGIPNQVKP